MTAEDMHKVTRLRMLTESVGMVIDISIQDEILLCHKGRRGTVRGAIASRWLTVEEAIAWLEGFGDGMQFERMAEKEDGDE